MGAYKYKAFISYSHQDDRWGKWLHRRLESYPLPRKIIGKVTSVGSIPRRLTPIFRDREELAAADNLGVKIEQALENSENLIIVCSPQAAQSYWVNQEILYFKRHNRGAQIFSVIVSGEPFASNIKGREQEECFPPALRFQLGDDGELSDIQAEPLAADLRDHADGKRLGLLKLVSGMIGIGLDEVVQRDMKRTRRRVTAVTSGALTTVLAMGTLTVFALDARQEAEQRRHDAEELIGFMLTDLRDKLEPAGQLNVLEEVGDRALEYYERRHNDVLSCSSLSTKARAHYLKTRISRDKQESSTDTQHAIIAMNFMREKESECLAHPEFVISYVYALQWSVTPKLLSLRSLTNDFSTGLARKKSDEILESYSYSRIILENLKNHPQYQLQYDIELSDIDNLMGEIYFKQNQFSVADNYFDASVERLGQILTQVKPESKDKFTLEYADAVSWRAFSYEKQNEYNQALKLHLKSRNIYDELATNENGDIINWRARFSSLKRDRSRAEIYMAMGDTAKAKSLIDDLGEKVFNLVLKDPANKSWQKLYIEITSLQTQWSKK